MNFRWYEEISLSENLTQGDILTKCHIPILNSSVYDAILMDYEEPETPLEIREADLIVLSQACDLQNEKINTVVLSPVWSLEKLIQINDYYKGKDARESLRQGKEPSYHLLRDYKSENYEMDYSVVDFHQIFTLPKDFLRQEAKAHKYRIRLLPPYREHLSQAFARYFMRVGLPLDISKEDIKNYSRS